MPSRLHLPHLLWPASRSAQMTTALKLMQYVTQQWWPTLPRTQASQSTTWAQLCVRCWLAEDTLHPRRGKHLWDPAQDKDNAKLMFCSMTGHEKLQIINQVWLCMWSAFLDYQSKNKKPTYLKLEICHIRPPIKTTRSFGEIRHRFTRTNIISYLSTRRYHTCTDHNVSKGLQLCNTLTTS